MSASRPDSRPPSSSTATVGLLAVFACTVLLVATLASPAAAAPPPADVCGACGDDFEEAAAAAGGDVRVASSAMDVFLSPNGSARVEVVVDVGPEDAAWVAANSDAVVAELAAEGGGVAPVPADATIRTADGVATLRYEAPAVAYTSPGGVVVVDALADGRTTGWEVDTDQLRLHAPENHVVTHGPATAPMASWTLGDHVDDAFVVYAPDTGVVSTLATQYALAVETWPAFLRAAALVLAPVVGVVALLGYTVDATATRFGDWDAHTLGTATVVASALVLAALAVSGLVSTYFFVEGAAPLFTATTGLVVGALAATERLDSDRSLIVATVALPLALGASAAAVGAYAQPAVANWTVGRALASGLLAAQLGLFVVLGATRHRPGTSAWLRLGAVVLPAVGVVALLGPAPVLLGWVVVLLLVAHPAYWLGASIGPGLRSV